ncbi:MAG: hypothetical protein K6F32_07690 [Bacilli bacterium]|nr:hypothetical protein [Bacilli bacterium]
MNDSLEKVAKAARIIFPVLAIAMIVMGAIRFFAGGDYAGLGEDGVLALFFIAVGYCVTPIVNYLDKKEAAEEEENAEHDTGL